MINDYCLALIQKCLDIPNKLPSNKTSFIPTFWFNEDARLAIPLVAIWWDNDLDFGQFPFEDIPWYEYPLDFGQFPFENIPW